MSQCLIVMASAQKIDEIDAPSGTTGAGGNLTAAPSRKSLLGMNNPNPTLPDGEFSSTSASGSIMMNTHSVAGQSQASSVIDPVKAERERLLSDDIGNPTSSSSSSSSATGSLTPGEVDAGTTAKLLLDINQELVQFI